MAKKRFGKSATTDDLLRSDSDDENYTEGPAERSPKKSGGGRKQPASRAGTKRKNGSRSKTTKRRGTYSDVSDDVSDIEDDESEDDFISEEEHEEQHPVEIGATGRTKRVVACKPTNYKESDSDSDEQVALSSSEVEDDRSNQPREPRSLIVTLKLEKSALARFEEQPSTRSQLLPRPKRQKLQKDPPILATSGRVTRATSAIPLSAVQTRVTAGGKAPPRGAARTRGRQVSAEPTRKSGRIHNTQEPMAALSNSGNHVVVTNLPPPTVSTVREESPVEDEEVVEVLQPQKTQVTAIEEDTEPLSVEPATVNRVSSQLEIQDSQHEENDHSIEVEGSALVAESVALYSSGQEGDADEEEEEEEEDGPTKRTRTRAASRQRSTTSLKTLRPTDVTASEPILEKAKEPDGSRRMLGRRSKSTRGAAKGGASDDEDYHEEGAEQSDDSQSSGGRTPAKPTRSQGHRDHDEDEEYSDPNRRSTGSKRHRLSGSDPESQAELQQEVKDLQRSSKRTRLAKARELSGHESGSPKARRPKRKTAQSVDYRVVRPELTQVLDDGDGTSTSSKRKAVPPTRSLFDTNGPFGGGDVMPFFLRAAGLQNEPDSDSSDDDAIRRRGRGAFGGTVGMTPTGAHAPGLLPGVGQTHNTDPMQAGAPANMGRITKPSKNALADADPLGVSAEVNFDSVGGLDDRIQQLKEMVMLPLMYPEIFLAKKVTPPRGVLFHGPPGTGKTLLARAVASSFADANGKKVTFYMRKGADCLSKWVGEAERQLRLLFDEARNNQPSIIFFDEIDGLAPVRSSKQEQIHASIVSTLLALMDGMDGRGQVVVIGATNRPDAVDPALRRPGRFDREFYFPLPTTVARRSILDIHTKGWEPPLTDAFKDQLATLTKGYGGADLRALCTEAALNAMQRTYPQIYKSMDKLKVDPASVVVTARDFMMSLRKITPSSERSTASGASPLPEHVQPLLQNQLERIKERLKGIFPEFKRLSPLEDAEYEDEDLDAEQGFQREMMMENFESARVYRPRLLIHGTSGLGQQYLAAAVLHYMEKVHVQSFDLGTLLADATRTPETALVQFFTEIKRHKPSVIFIPNVDVWYETLPAAAIATFKGLLLSLSSNDRVLLFGISENPINQLDPNLTALFGYSRNDRFELDRPDETARFLYFEKVISHILKSPADFPKDPTARAKRQLPELERVPPPPPRQLTKAEKRDIAQKDRLLKNQLKIRLRPLMEDLKFKYKRFKKSVIDHDVVFRILAREVQVEGPHPPKDPNAVESDIQVVSKDRWNPYFEDDVLRVEDKETKKIYYNIDLDKVEERYSNGHYCTPQQFLLDLERIRHDAKLLGEKENQLKANEMLTNAEVYIAEIEAADTAWIASLEDMYRREQRKTAEMLEEAKKQKQEQERERLRIQEAAETGASQNHTAEEEEGGEPRDVPNIAPPKTPAPRQLSNGASEEEQHSHHTRDSDYPLYNTPGHHVTAVSTQFTQISAGAGGHVGVARIAPAETSMVLNDASTTTSGGKRTSDATTISQPQTASQPNSNPFSNHSNGFPGPSPTIDHPGVWGLFGVPVKGDSQLASTQLLVSSQEESQGGLQTTPAQNPPTYSDSRNLETTPVHRQHPPPQPILDSSPANKVFVIPPPAGPKLVCDAARVEEVHELLAKRTTGYSVEQLEQVNAAIMDCVWKSRMNYNRNEVATKVVEAFEEVEKDVKTLQSLMAASGSFE